MKGGFQSPLSKCLDLCLPSPPYQNVFHNMTIYFVSIPFQPTEIEKKIQNITLVVKRSHTTIETFTQLTGRKICSGGINMTASFITPVCNLIQKNITTPTGDVVETATDFFGDMCVPGTSHKIFKMKGEEGVRRWGGSRFLKALE